MFKLYYYLTYPITFLCLVGLFLYRKIITHFLGKSCRFFPTCSNYAWECFIQYGWLIGGFYTIKRLIKCQPNKPAGVDYVKLNLLGNYKWKC